MRWRLLCVWLLALLVYTPELCRDADIARWHWHVEVEGLAAWWICHGERLVSRKRWSVKLLLEDLDVGDLPTGAHVDDDGVRGRREETQAKKTVGFLWDEDRESLQFGLLQRCCRGVFWQIALKWLRKQTPGTGVLESSRQHDRPLSFVVLSRGSFFLP